MNPIKKENQIHDKLIELISNNPKGLTMSELVKEAGFSRKAIEKHLEILILENEIYMKRFGVTKVYYPHRKIQHFDSEKFSYSNKTIWFDILEGEFGKYLLIQKKKKIDNKWVHEHSITIPLQQTKGFLKALDNILSSSRMKKLLEEK